MMVKGIYTIWIFTLAVHIKGDLPCALRDYGHERRVCVCNATYCDTITRVNSIKTNEFVAIISSKEGLRFNKTHGKLVTTRIKTNQATNLSFTNDTVLELSVNTSNQYQKIVGYGAAFTDSAGININSLGSTTQEHLLRSYFSKDGIEYNLCRVPIGGTDFSTRTYSYDDGKTDPLLDDFALADEDLLYKIPLIQRALNMSIKDIHFITAPWSPPTWMKTSEQFYGFGFLKKDFYSLYAKYLLRFLDEYEKHNITFWAISTGNEPANGVIPIESFNSLGWWPWTFADWITNYFGPQLRNSSHNDTLILTFDDQRIFLPYIVDLMVRFNRDMLNYVDGFAVHWYLDFLVGGWVVTDLHNKFPEKFILYTEACTGSDPWDKSVEIGSWGRGESYISSIIENTNRWVTGWLDWNLALDLTGGPNWAGNNVDSSIIVNASANEFYKQPMFYAMGHVSKFIERDAVRVEMTPTDSSGVHAMAVLNPDGRIVIVMFNEKSNDENVSINIIDKGLVDLTLPSHSFATIIC